MLIGADNAYMTLGYDKFAVGLAADMAPYLSGRYRSYFERRPASPDYLPWLFVPGVNHRGGSTTSTPRWCVPIWACLLLLLDRVSRPCLLLLR